MSSPDQASLLASLRSAGHPLLELSAPGQGALLVLPYGGRVIGLFADGQGNNFLWVNPALARPDTAQAILAADAWVHTGGDRTWLSPENEIHVGDLADPWATYAVPAAVDPGHYTVVMRGESIWMQNRARVKFHRQNTDCAVEIEKSVRLSPNPLRLEAGFQDMTEVAFAGYELVTSLRLTDAPTASPRLSLWNIVVVPASGWVIVATWGRALVRDYFEPTGPERLVITKHGVRFRLDGQEQHKIAVRAADIQGRAGYLRALDPLRSTLLVRNFLVNSSGDYVDTPWQAPDELGYAFQSYNDGGQLGAFGELEYHTPAIGGSSGLHRHSDVSQLWAFSGLLAQIHRVAERLLGAESMPPDPLK